MVEIEEIEEIYQKDIELVEKGFLDSIKAGKNTRELDRTYREKIKLARDKYYKNMTDYIEKSKKAKRKKEKEKVENFKRFKVVPADLTLSNYQKQRNKYSLKWFKFHFSWRNKIRSATPNFILRFRIWLRMKNKRGFRFVFRIISRILNWFAEKTVNAFKKLASFVKVVLSFLVDLPGKFFGLFKRKKAWKAGGDSEKKEES